jgi:hypothetical protein
VVTEARKCGQCGAEFVPRREHARFCSARCRLGWNRDLTGDPAIAAIALQWSIAAMGLAIDELAAERPRSPAEAYTVIADAVWSVTIVDAALVRYYPAAYDAVIGNRSSDERRLIEETMAGLRFVRNRMGDDAGLSQFVEPAGADTSMPAMGITAWRWKAAPELALTEATSRAQAWERARYQGFDAQLAARSVPETFARAAAFLRLTAAHTTRTTDKTRQLDAYGDGWELRSRARRPISGNGSVR